MNLNEMLFEIFFKDIRKIYDNLSLFDMIEHIRHMDDESGRTIWQSDSKTEIVSYFISLGISHLNIIKNKISEIQYIFDIENKTTEKTFRFAIKYKKDDARKKTNKQEPSSKRDKIDKRHMKIKGQKNYGNWS